MPLKRPDIDQIATMSDLDQLDLAYGSVSDAAAALLSYQRTKQISTSAQTAWEQGDKRPILREVKARKNEIIRGAMLEIYQEYLPLRDVLKSRKIETVCDIGCGQGINDVFLHRDFQPAFTLVDIEQTDAQYHFWSDTGSGYASLAAAEGLLLENGVAPERLRTINPRKTDWPQKGHGFDLVTSFYSCGFHYPVDEYMGLFLDTLETGGAVCVDLRKSYLAETTGGIADLQAAAETTTVYKDRKSLRLMFHR